MANNDNEKFDKEIENQDEFVVIREKIKARPVDKRRLFINSGLTILSAVIFGLVACITFVFVGPFISERFVPVKEETEPTLSIEPVIFPEETPEEEMTPEDMMVAPVEEDIDIDLSELQLLEEQQIKDIISSITFTLNDYQNLYMSLAAVADNAGTSLVSLTTVTTDTDWLTDIYEGTKESAGVIVANNGTNLYILASYNEVKDTDSLLVKFANGIRVLGTIGQVDSQTGLCTVVVPCESINNVTMEYIKVATLGSSFSPSLTGIPVIAVGSPMGNYGSIGYGILTGNTRKISVVDNVYKDVTTDIHGSTQATGVLINLRGDVIGIISNKFAQNDRKNLISAIGITELKRTIENLVNETHVPGLGIIGSDVPEEAVLVAGAPMGTYVMGVSMDGPAMKGGVQSGDIITAFGDNKIVRFSELISQLRISEPGATVELTISRPVQGEYKEIKIEVILGD